MNQNSDTSRKSEDLSWLEQLQRNSWEPEVIISGIILAFLFAFPSKVYEFSAYLIQDLGIDFIFGSIILIYLTGIISIFKIFFVIHLSLRFLWAGLLGLSYAFPEGVIQEKLFKNAQGFDYQKPDAMVLKLEKICSSTFAYPVSMVIIFLGATVYLCFLLFVYLWLQLTFAQVYLFFILTVILILGLMMSKKKTKLKIWYSKSLVSSINAIYQSNTGKWFSIIYMMLIFLFSVPIIYSDTQDFTMFLNESNMLEKEIEWPAKHLYFEDHHDPEKRFPRAFLAKEEEDSENIRIGLARYEGDRKIMEDLRENYPVSLDTLSWQTLDETADLHRIYLDDSLVAIEDWGKYRLSPSGQKVYQSTFALNGLQPGRHRLRVEKLIVIKNPFTGTSKVRLLENWSHFEFIKK